MRRGRQDHPLVASAGVTSENVAAKYNISREVQDKFAAQSHARAAAARASGRFASQIVPVHTVWKDPKTGEEKQVTISEARTPSQTFLRKQPALCCVVLDAHRSLMAPC